jgi:pimeloyl-ACP methyl ester carboxylesterase
LADRVVVVFQAPEHLAALFPARRLCAGTPRPKHGQRLAELLPDARLVEIPDSYTLIMRDQPAAFACAIREFIRQLPDATARTT